MRPQLLYPDRLGFDNAVGQQAMLVDHVELVGRHS
jgi:hypothetical protein